ncbi:MAG: hypothetical protein ACI4AK_02895 [Lepagella sp.]
MKITRYKHMPFVTLVAMMLATIYSCSDDVVNPYNPDNKTPSELWSNFLGKQFTKESTDFYWTESDGASDSEITTQSIAAGEFVEFHSLTDSCVTIRYGCVEDKKFNLAEITDNKVNYVINGTYSPLVYQQYVDVPLYFINQESGRLFFSGSKELALGMRISFHGSVGQRLRVSKNLTHYDNFYLFEYVSEDGNSPELYWMCDDFKFDLTTLKCSRSPFIIDWNIRNWEGDLASLFPNPSDFLQLLLAIPVVKTSDYGFTENSTPEYVSIGRLLRIFFSGLRTLDGRNHYAFFTRIMMPYYPEGRQIDYPKDLFSLHYGGVNVMRILIEPQKLKSIMYVKTPSTYMLFANVLQSLLPEERCYFDLQYQLSDRQAVDPDKALKTMTLSFKEKESARHLINYLIMPMLVENRQAIKDYIRQDTKLSLHAETLCSAVDRLEEIYAGTTDLTLGYRMLCYPKSKDILSTIWHSPEFE